MHIVVSIYVIVDVDTPKPAVITFTSWIKNIDVPLARLDIVCLTSFNEGTPVSLIEAQASNVVVLSTDVGGVKDIVKNGETAFVIDDFSIENYSEKLLYISTQSIVTNFILDFQL